MKYILFGAGAYAKKAIDLIGKNNIVQIFDNDPEKWGTVTIEGIPVEKLSFNFNYESEFLIIISVSLKYQKDIINQLESFGIYNYKTLQKVQEEITKKKIESRIDYNGIYNKAIHWIYKNSLSNGGIICTSKKKLGYPEVSGYCIPSLLRFGHKELACKYAKWLCSIQKEDGSWYDTDNKAPYVFDSAQIIKGLLAIRQLIPEVDSYIIAGCDWIIGNMSENGRLKTPTKATWGIPGMCTELIHLYCLSPLIQASEEFERPEYREAAYRILNYYKINYHDEILNFECLSHFYAYVMEALLDMNEVEMAKLAMNNIANLQRDNGAVPAYNNKDWVCATGLFQFALVWFRLGDIERGNKAFSYACKLQNETGGWYGSYVSEINELEDNDYFPTEEISWTNKFFLDALYYKNIAEFNDKASSFLQDININVGQFEIIKNEILQKDKGKNQNVLDVGCGKGRYILNLLKLLPENKYYGVDLSEMVLRYITDDTVTKLQGSLTNIPFRNNEFDVTYTCEALEHAIDIESAVREMARVTKHNGKIIVIDKDADAIGRLEIEEWEVWFDAEELKDIMMKYCSEVRVIKNISYEDNVADGLFTAWIGKVN